MFSIKTLLTAAIAISAFAGAPTHAAYPDHPIRLIVPFGAGGITDIIARHLGKKMGDTLQQTIIIDNRPGAGGVIGAQLASNSIPDGYTLFMGTVGTQIVNPLIMSKINYNPDKQLQPVGMISGSPYVLAVRADLGPKTFAEFIAYAKAHPKTLNYGSAGIGSSPHLGLELLKLTTGIDILHIPFKSGSEAVNAAVGGQVDIVLDAITVIMPHVTAGKLRALAIASPSRLPSAQGVPTSAEVGDPALQISSWNALYTPTGTPPDIVKKLNEALQKTLADPVLRDTMAKQGTQAYTGAPDEYKKFMTQEKAKWVDIVKRANIKIN
ncbi:Bug family tripartite tricarboxylate transporter substrate binding protein [Paralcaligenes sp. KSB-10]|uniref:Bug family tripartite tricarboxylate transporter substrate binding protein n=1 Tax=Paralcaligenes sp. KSB-10 TaxID=2901142 RepID=UPI00351D925A